VGNRHFATCRAAEILPDGTMRIANAGHLPPYRNGKEMELEGSLPLGLSSEALSAAQTFTLEPGDHILPDRWRDRSYESRQ
jgi:hypothetical protein